MKTEGYVYLAEFFVERETFQTKTGHGPQLSIFIIFFLMHVSLLILCTVFVLFCVPFMCLCVILCTVYVYVLFCVLFMCILCTL